VRDLIDVRPGERSSVALMALGYFLLLVAYYLLKPARDSLFLTEVSATRLPVAFILSAGFAVPVSMVFARWSHRWPLARVVNRTFGGVLILTVLLWRLVLPLEITALYYVFYAWVGLLGGLATSQYWLLGNAVFDAAQAKRIFPLLGLGGILGAFLGGELTGRLTGAMGLQTLDLLTLSVLGFGLAWLVSSIVLGRHRGQLREGRRRTDRARLRLPEMARSIRSSRHLTLTVGLIGTGVVVATFIDYQFKTVSVAAYPDAGELTAFLGRFYGRVNLVSLLLQAVLASRLIRWLGVGGTLLLLPSVLAVGSVGMLLVPGLTAALVLRGGEIGLKYSVDRTSRELLFLPVPLELKRRTKVFIDLFVERFGRGLGGGLLLLVTALGSTDLRVMAAVTIGLLGIWLVLALMMRREYVESFRRALSRREIDHDQVRMQLQDRAAIAALVAALESDNPREISYALEMLKSVRHPDLGPRLRRLLGHPSVTVRRRATELLLEVGADDLVPRVRALLGDADLEVRRLAVAALVRYGDGETELRRGLDDPDPRIRNAALAFLARTPRLAGELSVPTETICRFLDEDSPAGAEGRTVLADWLGRRDVDDSECWRRLLEDDEPQVVAAALAGLGRRGETTFLPRLLEKLDDRRQRGAARRALAAYGVRALPALMALLRDETAPPLRRGSVPLVLAQVPEQATVDAVMDYLAEGREFMRTATLRTLNQLHTRHPDLRFRRPAVEAEIHREETGYWQLSSIARAVAEVDPRPAQALLDRVLREKRSEKLQRIFRLLGLIYPPRDIANAYQGLMSGRRVLQANAQEFLANLLRHEHRLTLLPMIDPESRDTLLQSGSITTAETGASRPEALARLLREGEDWPRACAIYASRPDDGDEVRALIAAARQDGSPVVRETAALVLSREEST